MARRFVAPVMAVVLAMALTGLVGVGAQAGASSCKSGSGSGPWGWCGTSKTGYLPPHEPDVKGGGQVKIGFLTSGTIHDKGFYESGVTALDKFAKKYNWKTVVLGSVNPSVGLQQAEAVCREGVDLVIVEIGTLSSAYPAAKSSACNGIPFVTVATTSSVSEIPAKYFYYTLNATPPELYAAGVAAGIYLKQHHATTAGLVTGPQLSFTTETAKALYEGLHHVIPNGKLLSSFTGSFTASGPAVTATNALIAKGIKVVYPYLGGSVGAVANVANKAGIGVITPGFTGCNQSSPTYAISALFAPGAYIPYILAKFRAGTMRVGSHTTFTVGKKNQDGATSVLFCKSAKASTAAKKQLNSLLSDIASGKINATKIVKNSTYNP